MLLYWEFQNIDSSDFYGYRTVDRCYPEDGWTDDKIIKSFEEHPSDLLVKVYNEEEKKVYYEYNALEEKWEKSE